jgi:uncharacterized protein YegP (UPF0339 family)
MRYELFQDKAGKWRYRARARNGRKLTVSEAYYSKWNALRAARKRGKTVVV